MLVALSLTASFISAATNANGYHHDHHEPKVKPVKPGLVVDMVDLSTNTSVGTVGITQTSYGVVFTPDFAGINPEASGMHGFHVHTNPSCAPSTDDQGKKVAGGAAGGHYDPGKTNSHGHPWTENNHLGDLPALFIDKDGASTMPVLAPRLKLADLHGRSLMVHLGGDTYSNTPALGGGGMRMICGVIDNKAVDTGSKTTR